jgi:hypothetical protein
MEEEVDVKKKAEIKEKVKESNRFIRVFSEKAKED